MPYAATSLDNTRAREDAVDAVGRFIMGAIALLMGTIAGRKSPPADARHDSA